MHNRLLALLLPALLAAACAPQPPQPTPGATLSADPTPSPILTASPSASPSGTPVPTATATATPTDPASPPISPSPTPTASQSPTAYDAQALAARLESVLERQRERFGLIGLGAAVVMPDGFSWSDGTGFAALAPERPAQAETPFVVGSITKTFITALVMQLAAEGELSLDDRLADWLPDYRRHNDATLRQLLAHTSGIYNYFEHPAYNRSVFGGDDSRAWRPTEILAEFGAPPYFPAGTGYHYSNTGFILLGLVIERATGSSLDEQLRLRLFEPLGLADTFFGGDGPPPARSAQAYLVGPNGPRLINDGSDFRPTRSAATVAWAAGAVVASAPDLAHWARTLYDGDLLADEYLAQMTDFAANPYSGLAYGLGTRTRLLEGRRMVGHTGSLRGYAAAMWHFPAEDITVVVLSNRGRIDVNPVADALARVALEAVGYLP